MDKTQAIKLAEKWHRGDCFRVMPEGDLSRLPTMPNVGYVFSKNEWIKAAEIDHSRNQETVVFLNKNDLIHYHGLVEFSHGPLYVFSRSSNPDASFFLAPTLFNHLKRVPMVQKQKTMIMKRRLR